jgi:hypothetical protein
MAIGLFVDGWAHINLRQGRLGPFFTPWHGILYAGFTALALWILTRNQRRGAFSIDNVPIGYGLALVGMLMTTVAVGGDAIWHTVFGEEVDVARLLAPFHLVLFTGAIILAASPFRSAWLNHEASDTPSSREFLPALISLMLASGVITFFMQFVSPFINWLPPEVIRLAEASPFHEAEQINGLAQVLIWNVLLLAPIMIMLRRWRPPFGSCTLLLGSIVGMISALNEFTLGGLVLAAVLAGLAADITIHRVWTPQNRLQVLRAVGVVTPIVLWATYFISMKVFYGLDGTGWPVEIWGGAIFINLLAGWGMSYLSAPSALAARHFVFRSDDVPPLTLAASASVATPASGLLPFLQELSDLVASAEAAASYGEAARQARDAARMLRAAAAKLPANLQPRFPMEAEIARVEILAAEVGPPTGAYLDSLRDAAGILAGTKRGLVVDEPARMLLLNLTARAEYTLAAADEAVRRQRQLLESVVSDSEGQHAMADATLRHLESESHEVLDLTVNGNGKSGTLDLVGDVSHTP